MTKTMIRLLGGAAVVAVVALFGRGAATPASADPGAVVMFNQTLCAALSHVANEVETGCATGPKALEYDVNGDAALHLAADRLGNNDGIIQAADFANVATFTGGQIHQEDGAWATPYNTMVVIAFVRSKGPVTFHTTAGTFAESGTQSWTCDGNPSDPNGADHDPDCTTVPTADGTLPAYREDGAVVANLKCTLATCPTRGTASLTVEQGGIVFPTTFTVVGEPVNVTFFTLEKGIQAGVPVNGPLDATSAAAACPFAANLPFIQKALAEAEKTVIVARAVDIDGTAISGAWINWSVDDPQHNSTKYFDSQGIMAQPVTPTLNLGGFGYGAPNILCAPAGATAGTVAVTARLLRSYANQPFDPFASHGVDANQLDSTNLSYGNVTFNVNAIPTEMTLTAAPAAIPCDGTTTSTVSAALTDAAGNPAISGTAVHFDVQVLGTANPIDTTTNDKGIATSTITPLAGDVRGLPVTVSVSVGGVQQPDMTQSILVQCTGGGAPAAAPAPAGGGAAAGSSSVAGASAPNLPRSGAAEGLGVSGGLSWALIAGAAAIALTATAGGVVVRRRSR